MSNLKIKDIETLETLSLDELDRVVGGKSWKRRRARRRSVRSVCPGVITTQPALDDGGVDLDIGDIIVVGG